MRSIPLFTTGLVFDTLGLAGVGGGAAALVVATQSGCGHYRPDDGGAGHLGCGLGRVLVGAAGIGAMIVGTVFIAVGIPLTISGARPVPDVQKGSAVPQLRISGAGGTLEWKF